MDRYIVFKDSNDYILFNKFNGTVYKLDSMEYNLLKNYEYNHFTNNKDLLQDKASIASDMEINSSLNITIELTDYCNLDCLYCYQRDKFIRGNIKEKTITSIINYIINVYKKNNYRFLMISFIGGEPLLCKEKIVEIYNLLQDNELLKEVTIFVKIDTNGTIPFVDLFEFITNLDIYITLSNEEDHNKKRIGLDFNSYRLIENNIKQIKRINNSSQLILRYNVDNNNLEEFDKFVGYVAENLKAVKRIEPGFIDNYYFNDQYNNTLVKQEFLYWNSSKAIDILINNGFKINFSFNAALSPCNGYQKYSCKIYSDGIVTTCDSMFYDKSVLKINEIENNIDKINTYFKKIKEYNPLLDEHCKLCSDIVQCKGMLFCRDKCCSYNDMYDDETFIKTFIKYCNLGKHDYFIGM